LGYTTNMKLEFDSIEEVKAFVVNLGGVNTATFKHPGDVALTLAKLANEGMRGGKIQAIKIFRAVTGHDLKASKVAIDNVWDY